MSDEQQIDRIRLENELAIRRARKIAMALKRLDEAEAEILKSHECGESSVEH